MSYGPTIDLTRPVAALRYGALLAVAALASAASGQTGIPGAPSLAPMIEAVSPAVVNIAVTSKLPTGPATPQDELLRRFFDFEGPPGRRREVEGAGSGVIVSAVEWLQGTLMGNVATAVAVMAVAAVGFMMLTGRLNWRFGATVIIGCFVLFGAGAIVTGIQSAAAVG